MATKLPQAQNRLYKNTFVCKNCKHKVRIDPLKILSGKVKCRKCNGKDFRTIRKK
jgi:Zn finger protein HypA/HybF involved in hydrogenase expression